MGREFETARIFEGELNSCLVRAVGGGRESVPAGWSGRGGRCSGIRLAGTIKGRSVAYRVTVVRGHRPPAFQGSGDTGRTGRREFAVDATVGRVP